jgi:threonine dehydratase
MRIPQIDDVRAAAAALEGKAFRTPLLRSDALDALTGLKLFLKPECLQVTGSFKFRGAYNALSRLDGQARQRGVVASSSGNHAQGVAEAARLFGVRSTIVMPADAPALKVERTRRSGARVIFYDRHGGYADRDRLADQVAREEGAAMIHPFENADVIAGQGTAGLELCQSLAERGLTPDRVLVCTGGGGLTAGIALAVHASFPLAKVHSVEPEGFDDYRRSLAGGRPVANDQHTGSACDALLSNSPGATGFAINREHVAGGLVVSDAEAFDAMRVAFRELKLVLEPGGAVSLAAALKHAAAWRGETVACILSGGNVDPELFARVLAGAA